MPIQVLNIIHDRSQHQKAWMLAELEDWHSDLKWMQQTFIWPPGLQTQCGARIDLSKYCILLQPYHITSYCQQFMLQSNPGMSQLDVARQQRLLTAVSRVSMHQRMQIVFMGFRERFAEVGVCTQGESGMLTFQIPSGGVYCLCYSAELCICLGMPSDEHHAATCLQVT